VENLGDIVAVMTKSFPIPGATLHKRIESETHVDSAHVEPPNLLSGWESAKPKLAPKNWTTYCPVTGPFDGSVPVTLVSSYENTLVAVLIAFLTVTMMGRPSPLPAGVLHINEDPDIHTVDVHAVDPCLTIPDKSDCAKLYPKAILASCPERTVLPKYIVVT